MGQASATRYVILWPDLEPEKQLALAGVQDVADAIARERVEGRPFNLYAVVDGELVAASWTRDHARDARVDYTVRVRNTGRRLDVLHVGAH